MTSKKDQKETEVVKINKWDGSAVKNALDDAVKEVLVSKYNYTENFALLDGRLILCGIAVTVAAIALVWDYLYPFPTSKTVLVGCVTGYFFLMGVLSFWTTYKEKGIFVVAVQRDPTGFDPDYTWEGSSYMKKYDDKYNLSLSVKNSATGAVQETNVTRSVANFISEDGLVLSSLVDEVVATLHDSLTSQKKEK